MATDADGAMIYIHVRPDGMAERVRPVMVLAAGPLVGGATLQTRFRVRLLLPWRTDVAVEIPDVVVCDGPLS
jgi:hypothetical protein